MTNNELFDEIKLISERLKEIFNPINESEIISQFYIGLLDDLLYRNILQNFFNNLTEENIKDCNLNTIDLVACSNVKKRDNEYIKSIFHNVECFQVFF